MKLVSLLHFIKSIQYSSSSSSPSSPKSSFWCKPTQVLGCWISGTQWGSAISNKPSSFLHCHQRSLCLQFGECCIFLWWILNLYFIDQIEKEDWADHDTGPIIENRKGFLTFVKQDFTIGCWVLSWWKKNMNLLSIITG